MNFKFTANLVKTIVGVFVTISLFLTFTQEAFTDPVSANLLFSQTPEYPVFVFIIGAFLVGLMIGLIIAVGDHLTMVKKTRVTLSENDDLTLSVSRLEREVAVLEEDLVRAQEAVQVTAENPTTGSLDPIESEGDSLSDDDLATIE